MTEVQKELFALQDLKYRAFHSKLMPTIDPELIIGVRTPQLRRFARQFSKTDASGAFLRELPHHYYEENNLHGFLIESMRDFDEAAAEADAFLPYVDNWATCDLMRPKAFAKNKERLLPWLQKWMAARHPYTIRFGIEMLMVHFLDEDFKPEYPEWVAALRSDEYYVNMMIAWYFATALAKQYDAVLPFLQQHRLSDWTHRKTIQKAIESDRIKPEQKMYLRTLK